MLDKAVPLNYHPRAQDLSLFVCLKKIRKKKKKFRERWIRSHLPILESKVLN